MAYIFICDRGAGKGPWLQLHTSSHLRNKVFLVYQLKTHLVVLAFFVLPYKKVYTTACLFSRGVLDLRKTNFSTSSQFFPLSQLLAASGGGGSVKSTLEISLKKAN